MTPRQILYCSSEAYPLIKTGGLGDVAGSLPRALQQLGHEVRLLLPAYRDLVNNLPQRPRQRGQWQIDGQPVTLWQTTLPGSRVKTWLVDCPEYFDRPGNPYHDADGEPWPDNAQRFALFDKVAALLASDQLGLEWQPDIAHGNDWQCGLLPVYLNEFDRRPATVFTIHNLAYQGLFDRATFDQLGLPESLWHFSALEYHDQLAFIKGGLVYADHLTTVSPTYAREIQTPAFGQGMEGLLAHRAADLSGILNGIDTRVWNPGTDRLIVKRYNRQNLSDKQINKQALQAQFDLPQDNDRLLMGMVTRLAEQKGIDLVLDSLPDLVKLPVQLVILGSGDKDYEQRLQQAVRQYPRQLGLTLGYDESLAHRIEAGADLFVMPSRFEPCGLNQLYSQRYGTLPLVTPVGGLADTVVDTPLDTTGKTLQETGASGFVMSEVSQMALEAALHRAVQLYARPALWQQVQRVAMGRDFSWQRSAGRYVQLYEQLLQQRPDTRT
ncbi:glycogen synthase GlgA [Thiohalophilus sp.]|uniref:glycogen synthase GlgA n=1 Tax=Thiohalophilus sp. TaxID=3028392 RepID=UPI002ACDC4A6|nr:glycogen synthase GlgA [Thiohalophilus sp.]MDZ7804545.1 glycogen synthase GlgA [Thiohalophilus sp.]